MSRHRRSVEALARREERRVQRVLAARFVFDNCFLDRERSEQVCLVTREQIADHLEARLGCSVTEYTDHEKGEVISDSKGRGSFQV